jgi:tryptophan-rich sensory protein
VAGSEVTAWRVAAIVLGIGILVAYVALSGRWVSTGDSWYVSLDKPWWQPPPAVFGLIWPYNFVVLGIAAVLVPLRASTRVAGLFLCFFALSVVCAVAWAYLFYVPHNLVAAAIALTMAAAITIGLLVTAFATTPWLGWVLVPYQLWLAIAASLSWGYVALSASGG